MRKLALSIVGLATMAALVAPVAATARAARVRSACVVVDGPATLHLQLGYAPVGPVGCRHLP